MNSWNYRVIRHKATKPAGKGIEWLSISEVYYDKSGRIESWVKNEATPMGETFDDLAGDLELIQQALQKPIIDAESLPGYGGEIMSCKDCRHCWYNAARREYCCDKRGGMKLPGLRACKEWRQKDGKDPEKALAHEQQLNEGLRERVLELETEVKTLKLKLAAKYAGEVDDN